MKTIYFIDSENVNDAWISIATSAALEDELLVFYTAKSPHMSYEKVIELTTSGTHPINWVKCVEGNNALDFQLVTELGFRIATSPESRFVLVSNDNGFEAAVRYWKQKGVDIVRMKSSDCKQVSVTSADTENAKETEVKTKSKKSKIKKVKQEVEENVVIPQETGENEGVLTIRDFYEEIEVLSRFIPVTKLTLFHDCFVCLYTQDKGDEMYYAMKAEKSEVEKLKKNYLKRADSRNKAYIEYIFSKAGISKQIAGKVAVFYNKLENPSKNLSKMNTELIQLFGMENGSTYYKILKKHVKVINKL